MDSSCSWGKARFNGDQIQVIADMVKNDDFVAGEGRAEPYDHKEEYFKDLLERIGTTLPLHVGVIAVTVTAPCSLQNYWRVLAHRLNHFTATPIRIFLITSQTQ